MTYKEALRKVLNETCLETIYDSYETPDYFEFKGECGGDMLRYRVYKNNGNIYEK